MRFIQGEFFFKFSVWNNNKGTENHFMAISTKDKKLQNGFNEKNKKINSFLILTKVDKSCKIQGEFFGWILNIVEKRMLKKIANFFWNYKKFPNMF